MSKKKCVLLGAPIGTGAGQEGCQLGPDTLRIAGMQATLESLGYEVADLGNVTPEDIGDIHHSYRAKNLAKAVAWTRSVQQAAYQAFDADAHFPIFLGGDHSLAFGTVPAVARYAQDQGRPLYVLWIDAHTDYHTLDSSESGNVHGMPVAYFTGEPSFQDYFPALNPVVPPENVCLIGIRSVDPAERARVRQVGVKAHDMRRVDEKGIIALIEPFLETVKHNNGLLHVSLDVDGLDPSIAPAVGTTVEGGLTFREAHLIMETVHDHGLACSLDLVELNPLLDERAKTAKLLIDLTASLLGRNVLG